MAVSINTYAGLRAGFGSWLARASDPILDARYDDFQYKAEQRIYYGHASDNPEMASPALRISEMETVDDAFSLTSGTIAQPAGFLELISAKQNSPEGPMEIVSQRTLDGYGTQSLGGTFKIAVSGTNFRFLDAPTSGTATLRYYKKLTTPTEAATNDILTLYPDVYLYAVLVEADIFLQDAQTAIAHLSLYNATVAGLNARTQRITASANPVMRLRAGMTP